MGALDELVFIFQVLGKIVGRRKRKGKERRRIHCRDSTRIIRENYCAIGREGKEFLNRRNEDYILFFFFFK